MDSRQLAGGLVLAVSGLAAFCLLVMTGHSDQVDKLVAFVGPSIAALLIIGNQSKVHQDNKQRLEQQDTKLDTIEKQTNGVMDDRIREGTKAAITEMLEERLK